MGRDSTGILLYEDVLQLTVKSLKRDGFIGHGTVKKGVSKWSRSGELIGSIGIKIDEVSNVPYIELDYTYRNEAKLYKLNLVSIPSNLGRGEIYYFQCPQTFKLCRKLYCVNGMFLHRSAFNSIMYESQTLSKKNRDLIKALKTFMELDNFYEETNSKYFKKSYNGKPTKRYLKLLEKKKLIENNKLSLESLLLS